MHQSPIPEHESVGDVIKDVADSFLQNYIFLIFSSKSFRNDELLFASNWIGLCNKYFLFETFLKVVFKMKYKASWQCNIHCLFSQFVKHYSILNSKICTEERNSKNAFLISKYINSIKWKPVENNCYYLYVEKCFFYFMDID